MTSLKITNPRLKISSIFAVFLLSFLIISPSSVYAVNGDTITEVASLEHDISLGNDNSLVKVDSDTYALAYTGDGSDGFIKTFSITGSSSIASSSIASPSSGEDNSAPTLGTGSNGQRLIDDGFVYNANPIDVNDFRTDYPLVRTPVGQINTLDLKIFENQGANQIEFISVHFGVPQIKAQGEAIITYYPFNDYTKVYDPNNLLSEIDISMEPVKCKDTSEKEKCVQFSLEHSFNEAPLSDIVRVTIADKTRNHSDVFFNDGVEVYGDSLNPPNIATIAAQGNDRGLVNLVQTDRAQELWVDQEDNTWSKNMMGNFFQVTPNKYTRIVDDSVSSQGYDRMQSIFRAYMEGQELYAKQVWDGTLIQSELPDYIPDVARTETLRINDPILQAEIIQQVQLAEQQWDSQSIQGMLGGYIPTLYTTQELGVTDADMWIEMQKANQWLEELYYLNKINEKGAIIPKSPNIQYKGMTDVKLSDDTKISEADKARQLLYEMYGIE